MLTLARALAGKPKVVLADELSLGLAPLIVHRVLGALREVAAQGVGVLLVEQQIGHALRAADHVYVMRAGRLELAGSAVEMRGRVDDIEACYFAGNEAFAARGKR